MADDTFQDQGPGSLEIYKLDLLRERPLLQYNQVTPVFPGKGKSKAPKKTIGSHAANPWKSAPKTVPGLPMLLHKQSNSFDDPSTEVPPDLFGVGGVPELQVGCEGLEAAHYKEKRSLDRGIKKDPWLDVTPITLDLDYEGELEEEEEMDELLKLKKLETTTRGVKRNRGDMDAKLHSEFHSADKGAEKLPVRGDLGRASNASDPRERGGSLENGSLGRGNRRILWAVDEEERGKRALWGFGENEGVVSSDELQTEGQRRRMYQERRRKEEEERRRANLDIERIRGEYERRLDERQREEEERQRRVQQSNRWQQLEAEQRRRLEEEGRGGEASRARSYQDRARGEEERRQREEEERRRRRKEEEEEMDRRRLEERRREWSLKQRRIEEEERRREPSNFTYPANLTAERERHHRHHQQQQQSRPDPTSMIDRRRKEEERKLLDYVRRNQPVHVANDSRSSERSLAEQRRRAEEVRRIYNPGNGRRNHGPSAPTNIDPRSYAEEGRRREAARRIEEEEERRGRMREAERREEEVRRRMSRWYEEERRRKEAARLEAERMAKVQREEEARRSRAGGGYEDRRRFDDHRRRQDTGLIPANLVLNKSRRPVEHARQRQEEVERRRQEERR